MTPFLVVLLVALAKVDLRERRLPDRLTLPLAALGLGLAWARSQGTPSDELLGLVGGFVVFWVLGAAHFRVRGVEGLGLGDAKLLGAAGAWLGWRAIPLLVLGAALGALAWTAVRTRGAAGSAEGLAFGPWLAAALLALWLLRLAGHEP